MWSTLNSSKESLLDQHIDPPEGLLGAAGSQLLHGLGLVLDWEDFLDQDAVPLGLLSPAPALSLYSLLPCATCLPDPAQWFLLTRTQYI